MHKSVLLTETIDAIVTDPEGVYVDVTFGRGGHTRALLERLGPKARVIAFDCDPEAIAYAKANFGTETRLIMIHAPFSQTKAALDELGLLGKVRGLMADLGVSSPQLDQAARGFSFMRDGPLDMRMDPSSGESVASWIKSIAEQELADIIYRYGEERFSRRIAKAIVIAREKMSITTTKQLAEIVASAQPRQDKYKHPATRTFQALRIFINQELAQVEQLLGDLPKILMLHGRAAIISFHSLEDRPLKACCQAPPVPKGLPIKANDSRFLAPLQWVVKKCRASKEECASNPRSRSATLRVMERKL